MTYSNYLSSPFLDVWTGKHAGYHEGFYTYTMDVKVCVDATVKMLYDNGINLSYILDIP